MSLEDELRRGLDEDYGAARPSPELEASILESVRRQPLPAGRPRRLFALRLAGVAAVLLVAVVVVPLAFRGGFGGQGGGPTAPPAVPSAGAAQHPYGTATFGSGHFDGYGLAFDYPASWRVEPSELNMHYVTVLAFLGTGSGSAYCTTSTPGPNDKWISAMECGQHVQLAAGQIEVALSRTDGPPRPGPIDPTEAKALQAGERYVTVGGLPAVYSESTTGLQYGADLSMGWTLSMPQQLISRYSIVAYIKGPGTDALKAQVQALVASLRYDPPAPTLDPADAAKVTAAGVEKQRANDGAFGCFPATLGAETSATVTSIGGYARLVKALPVVCRTAKVEPYAIGLWKLTLTTSWTAAADRKPGTVTTTIWLTADGTPTSSEIGGDEPPYMAGEGPPPSVVPPPIPGPTKPVAAP